MTPQQHLEVAAYHLEQARLITGESVATFFGTPLAPGGWQARLAEFAREDAQRGQTPRLPWVPGLLPNQLGGAAAPRSWESHNRLLEAAERGELNNGTPWPMQNGRPFHRETVMGGTTVEMHEAVVHLWTSPEGRRWKEHPLNAQLPCVVAGDPQL